jgi:hypothetical protein
MAFGGNSGGKNLPADLDRRWCAIRESDAGYRPGAK